MKSAFSPEMPDLPFTIHIQNTVAFFNTGNLTSLSSNEIKPVYVDKAHNLWFETNTIGINRSSIFNHTASNRIGFPPLI